MEYFNSCPTKIPEREEWLFDKVLSGDAEFYFSEITHEENGHSIKLNVFTDALKLNGVRINTSASLSQKIADVTNCSLMTPKIYDLSFINRGQTVKPSPQQITNSLEAMISHSERVEKQIIDKSKNMINSSVGKIWVLDNRFSQKDNTAVNYGWILETDSNEYQGIKLYASPSLLKGKSGKSLKVIQGPGIAHNYLHTDYSQICVLVSNYCEYDGKKMMIQEILDDAEKASIISHCGKMNFVRQTHVPIVSGYGIMPTDFISASDLSS